mmetsp:Transcript_18752/g.47565  ORF Transcript_18752/g.47565 Transcript_18752/m.47565 type:complete len:204 (-) Transcript_18752:535-1146(-)
MEMVRSESYVNAGSFMYSFTFFTCFSVRLSLSNSTSERRKLPSAIMDLAPPQLTSLRPRSTTTHSHTFCTRMCGLAKERISVMSSLRRSCSAAAASSSAGMASSSAASASAFSTAMFSESILSCASLSTAALALVSTSVVLLAMTSSSSLHSLVACSTTTLASLSSFCIASTSVAAWISFCSPPLRRPAMSSIILRLVCSARL